MREHISEANRGESLQQVQNAYLYDDPGGVQEQPAVSIYGPPAAAAGRAPENVRSFNPCSFCCCGCCNLRANCLMIAFLLLVLSLHIFYPIAVVNGQKCEKKVHYPDACSTEVVLKVLTSLHYIFCLISAESLLIAVCGRMPYAALVAMVGILIAAMTLIVLDTFVIIVIHQIIELTNERGEPAEDSDPAVVGLRAYFGTTLCIWGALLTYFAVCAFAFFRQIQAGVDREPLSSLVTKKPKEVRQGSPHAESLFSSQTESVTYYNYPPSTFYEPQHAPASLPVS